MRLIDGSSSRAVLIGASEFIDPALPDLPAVLNNLDDLEEVLTDKSRTGLPPEHCTVLRDPNDPDSLGEALEAAAGQAQDMLLVYYAGHGLLDRNNELYLSVPRSRRKRASLSAIPFGYIREVMRDSPAANRIMILDCCFSGRAIDDAMSDASSILSGQIDITGTYTLTSTSANAPALAPDGSRWTAFTGELLRLFREGVAEPVEWLTLDLIYRHLRSALARQGLPQPEQRGTQTAGLAALTRNPQLHRNWDSVASPEISAAHAFPNNDLFGLLGWKGVATFDPAAAWQPRPPWKMLRIPFGVTEHGHPIELDIKQDTSGGDGPHGICVGSTGSGKIELLRTIILALMMTHGPDQLAVMITDADSGLDIFERAPHIHPSSIGGLARTEPGWIDHIFNALDTELRYRADTLKNTGTKDIWEYNQMRSSGKDLQPLPVLLVVVDDFTNVFASKPTFIDLVMEIGRIGRSLGVHLLMASYGLKQGDLRNLESCLSYRIGLRVNFSADSNRALGIPDAANLPLGGGHGYLRRPNSIERFRNSYVSGQANLGGEFKGMTELQVAVQIMINYSNRDSQI
jgi:S-DNA-T family DNA segregation ATPase FtsK/SpoIIIE